MMKIIKSVGILAFRDNKVLLVLNKGIKSEHRDEIYGIPAGRPFSKESSLEAVIREFKEETGLITTSAFLVKLPKIYIADIKRKGQEGLVAFEQETFWCKQWEGELKANDETIPKWIEIDKLEVEDFNLLPNVKVMIFDTLKFISKM